MKLYKDIVLYVVVAVLAGLVTGCSGVIFDKYPSEDGPVPEESRAFLALHLAPVAATRAADDKEAMHSLRVVLLDGDGIVEYNRLVGADVFGTDGLTDLDYAAKVQLIPTTPGDKKIFLIANEESVTSVKGTGNNGSLTALLNAFVAGKSGFEDSINSVYFTPDFTKNIVLSSSYKFNIGEEEKQHHETFYLVHAATKFEFSFENLLENEISIEELSVSSIADDMYLMAHFASPEEPEEKRVTWHDGIRDRNEFWIDWLKEVSEDTTGNPDDPENESVNDKYWWIYDYLIPDPTHQPRSIWSTTKELPVSTLSSKVVTTLPIVYCPESKNLRLDSQEEQEYQFSVRLKNGDEEKTFTRYLSHDNDIDSSETSSTPGDAQNLRTLFRNTHVKVNVTISRKAEEIQLNLWIGVCPWEKEEIDIPTFD